MAKKNTKQKRNRKSGSTGFWFFALVVMLVGGVIFFSMRDPGMHAAFSKMMGKADQKKEIKTAKKTTPSNDTSPVHFDFYAELSKGQGQGATENKSSKAVQPKHQKPKKTAKVETASIKPTVSNKAAVEESSYRVTLATFNNESNAVQMRVSLLLSGVEVDVVKVKVGDQYIYRVQQGPYSSLQLAKRKQQLLLKRGVNRAVIEKV